MDMNIIIPIIIAAVAIIPGIGALINQTKKDKIQTQWDMARATQDATLSIIEPLEQEIYRLRTGAEKLETHIKEKYGIDEILYEQPTSQEESEVIHCRHCTSPNSISSMNCTQCGAPLK